MKSLKLRTEVWGTLKFGDYREDKEQGKVRVKKQPVGGKPTLWHPRS